MAVKMTSTAYYKAYFDLYGTKDNNVGVHIFDFLGCQTHDITINQLNAFPLPKIQYGHQNAMFFKIY